jgi:hypothetical protein
VRSCIVFQDSVACIEPGNEGRKIGENQERDNEEKIESRVKKEMRENKHSLLYALATVRDNEEKIESRVKKEMRENKHSLLYALATVWKTRVSFPTRKRDFCPLHIVQVVSGPIQLPIQLVQEALSL